MNWNSLKTFLQSVPDRILGAHIETGAESFTHLSSKAKFPYDENLERRIVTARAKLGTVQPKSLRKV